MSYCANGLPGYIQTQEQKQKTAIRNNVGSDVDTDKVRELFDSQVQEKEFSERNLQID